MRAILNVVFCTSLAVGVSLNGYGQVLDWKLSNGKAQVQKVFSVPGKNSSEIYKRISRWLVSTYRNSEDVLKARIEDEYLRGQGYQTSLLKFGGENDVSIQYTFTIDVKNEKARFTISNATVIYAYSQENESVFPIEVYLTENDRKKGRDTQSERIMDAVDIFSDSLIDSFEKCLTSDEPGMDTGW